MLFSRTTPGRCERPALQAVTLDLLSKSPGAHLPRMQVPGSAGENPYEFELTSSNS